MLRRLTTCDNSLNFPSIRVKKPKLSFKESVISSWQILSDSEELEIQA